MATSYAFESVSLDVLKQCFSDKQKELHVLGPLLPPGYGIKTQNGEEGTSSDFETFLGEMLVRHGERSVFFVRSFFFFLHSNLYKYIFSQVCFGSLFWPPVQEYVDELIEALIDKKAPFVRCLQLLFFFGTIHDSNLLLNQILSYSSKYASISEQLEEKIQSSGLGMTAKWSPQQFILNHPVLNPNYYLLRHTKLRIP